MQLSGSVFDSKHRFIKRNGLPDKIKNVVKLGIIFQEEKTKGSVEMPDFAAEAQELNKLLELFFPTKTIDELRVVLNKSGPTATESHNSQKNLDSARGQRSGFRKLTAYRKWVFGLLLTLSMGLVAITTFAFEFGLLPISQPLPGFVEVVLWAGLNITLEPFLILSRVGIGQDFILTLIVPGHGLIHITWLGYVYLFLFWFVFSWIVSWPANLKKE